MVMAAAGLLAASVVVFAPLALAGWHVTRNRVLFFSTIFFIILAATVHILPYAPSLSRLFSSFSSFVSSSSSSSSNLSCLQSLYSIDFLRDDDDDVDEDGIRWTWSKQAPCKLRRFHKREALQFLSGTWIVVAGDSQARFLLLSLLDLVLDDPQPIKSQLFKFHSDFSYTLDEHQLKVDFFWAPYTANLTRKLTELHHLHQNGSSRRVPDVIVAGAGLWHMLHVSDPDDYAANLRLLAAATAASGPGSPRLFWMNLPVLIPGLLNTEAKREKLTAALASRYDEELGRSNMTLPGGAFRILDVNRLSALCGVKCTSDGMHYASAVYAALVQIMLQTLALTRTP